MSTSRLVTFLLVIQVLMVSSLQAQGSGYYLYSFETTKRGKHVFAVVANINNEDDCRTGIQKFKSEIADWKKTRIVNTKLVLLTLVISKETLEKCKISVKNIVNHDKHLKSTINDLQFDVTIVEKKPKKNTPSL